MCIKKTRLTLSLILLLAVSITGYCQSNNEILEKYLENNSYKIDFSDSSVCPLFSTVMQNKKMFVYGEGGSHYLQLHNKMRVYLLEQFEKFPLKYFFVEGGRTSGYNLNQAVTNPLSGNYKSKSGMDFAISQEQKLFHQNNRFAYKGIDMEWGSSFYKATKNICDKLPVSSIDKLPIIKNALQDTSYLHYDDSNGWNNQKMYLKLYKKWQKEFYSDSLTYKSHLGSQYETFRYFMTNLQIEPPLGNRNPGMLRNILFETNTGDTSSVYILDVGIAHSMTLANGLSKTDLFRNKVLVMQVYCENCFTEKETVNNWYSKGMDEVIECFSKAAKTDITIFDLSKLPPEFSYLTKTYGDLLLFAKNQN